MISLKCDAAGCGHMEPVAKIEKSLVGKPCPKCGANLLTEKDYEAGKLWVHVISLGERLGILSLAVSDDDANVFINPHADALKIKIKPTPAASGPAPRKE